MTLPLESLPKEDRVRHAPTAEPAESPESETGGAYQDWGLPVQDLYRQNYLRLMVQDPYRLYCYWELSDYLFERFFPPGIPAEKSCRLILVLHDLTETARIPISVGASREWWLHVRPCHQYRTTLDVRYPDGHQEAILASSEVFTPRDTVSWPIESTDLLQDDNMRYLHLLSYSGASPIDREFLDILRQCEQFDQKFTLPEYLYRYLPDGLREVVRRLQGGIPMTVFEEYILKRYFPVEMHGPILDGSCQDQGAFAARFGLCLGGASSFGAYLPRSGSSSWTTASRSDGEE